jgi:hypothetical protein
MRRSSPDRILTAHFWEAGRKSYRYDGPADGAPFLQSPHNAACWLKQHDPFDRPCSEVTNGRLEVFHFVSRQAIRRVLGHTLHTGFDIGGIDPADVEDLIELAEWDPRNAGLGCTGHHRRLDWHATPELQLPVEAVPDRVLEFVLDWGFESEAEGKFAGDVAVALARVAHTLAGDGADRRATCGSPGDVVSGESDAGPGADPSLSNAITGAGIASPDQSTAGDGAAGQARAGCGPEEVQRRLGRSPDTANEGGAK